MKVNDLVRETDGGCTGIILRWNQEGWVVYFSKYECSIWMCPTKLEVIA